MKCNLRVHLVTIAFIGFVGFISNAHGGDIDEFRICVDKVDALKKLSCFDEIAKTVFRVEVGNSAATRKFQLMDIDDLKLDIGDLSGQCISTVGVVTVFGDNLMLQKGQMDMNPIMISQNELSRDQRKIALKCSPGCRLKISGIVEEVMFQNGIRATKIERP